VRLIPMSDEMKLSAKFLSETITRVLKNHGYRKKGTTWYSETDDCVCVVNLQKSQWGDQYYINLAVFAKILGDKRDPKEYECHIRGRLGQLEGVGDVDRVLDLENNLYGESQRQARLESILIENAIPFLKSLDSMAGITAAFHEGKLRRFLTTVNLRKHLGVVIE
jgi:hypothetical protein